MLDSGNAGKPDYLEKAKEATACPVPDTSEISVYRESIKEYRSKYWKIRVWRKIAETDIKFSEHDDDVGGALKTCEAERFDLIATRILVLPDVNAVEVKDTHGNGCVFYKDWP